MIELTATETMPTEKGWEKKMGLIIVLSFMLVVLVLALFLLPGVLQPRAEILGSGGPRPCTLEDVDNVFVKTGRKWYLLGNELGDQQSIQVQFGFEKLADCNSSSLEATVEIPEQVIVNYPLNDATEYNHKIEYDQLDPGKYNLRFRLKEKTSDGRFREQDFKGTNTEVNISHPVYVVWTMDWEGMDFNISNLALVNQLTERAQKVPISHFFNPRYYITDEVRNERADQFLNWILERRNSHDDYVGLHQHMFFDMVEAYGVEPKKQPTWANRGTGSDVPLTEYTYEEQKKIIEGGLNTLREKGFTNIRAFRAGGWFANEDTLRALEELGLDIDSSGRTYYVLGNDLPGPWRLEENQQPYYPCRQDQNFNCEGDSAFNVLEMPNNGGESWRFTASELVERFTTNYRSGPAEKTIFVNYLSHPEGFQVDFPKMSELFGHIDRFLYTTDSGPVIYTNLHNAKKA